MEIGIDVGSTGIKIVFVDKDQIIWKKVVPTKPGQSDVVQDLVQQGLTECGMEPSDITKTCVTGYGRNLIESAGQVVDEISANAAGIHRLTRGTAGTVINIGGTGCKDHPSRPVGPSSGF